MNNQTHLISILAGILWCGAAMAQQEGAKNLLRGADVEVYPEAPLPQEDWNTFYAPVAAELMAKHTYFTVVSGKGREGSRAIRIELTPESRELWKAHPAKPDTTAMFLHDKFRPAPKQDYTPLAADKVVFSVWVHVEKGAFKAQFRARARKGKDALPDLIRGTLNVTERGKWVQVKLEGRGAAGLTSADIRLELESEGNFEVYLDDFFFGAEK
jgi:hypothetical protein